MSENGMTCDKIIQVLEDAVTRLKEDGWTRGRFAKQTEEGVNYCALGAVYGPNNLCFDAHGEAYPVAAEPAQHWAVHLLHDQALEANHYGVGGLNDKAKDVDEVIEKLFTPVIKRLQDTDDPYEAAVAWRKKQ